jgi:glycosyltransferase involved in cell wall biosynthesis
MAYAVHLMLFDLYAGGHHGQYLQQLVRYWGERGGLGRLDVVVPPAAIEAHPELKATIDRYAATGVRLVLIDEPVHLDPRGPLGLVRTDREHGRLLRRYVERLRPDHVLLMYFDHVQLSLAFDLTFGFRVRFSGIYFRPSFHYGALGGPPSDWKERLDGLRKLVQLWGAIRNPHFDILFSLDPFAVSRIRRLAPLGYATALPDGIEPQEATGTPAVTRRNLGVEDGRRVLLLFGSLGARKGVFRLLEAVRALPDAVAQRTSVVLAGSAPASARERLHREVAKAQHAKPVQVVLHDERIPDADVPDLLAAADVVLLPYQRHLGSSGVLVRAAAAGKPVLGDGYGLLGAQIRRHGLGVTVDATRTDDLIHGLYRCVTTPPEDLFDLEAAAAFAGRHTAEHFAETIYRFLAPPLVYSTLPPATGDA